MTTLDLSPLASTASEASWEALVAALMPLSGAALDDALASLRSVSTWPASTRALRADHPWMTSLFAGVYDPRLALVGRAHARHTFRYTAREERVFPPMGALIRRLARHLQPSFDPPRSILDAGNEITYASGCGGGCAWETQGDERQGIRWRNDAVEHSADMEDAHTWVAYGMDDGCAVTLLHNDYFGGTYQLDARGPAPAILEVATVWGEISRREVSIADVDAMLAPRTR